MFSARHKKGHRMMAPQFDIEGDLLVLAQRRTTYPGVMNPASVRGAEIDRHSKLGAHPLERVEVGGGVEVLSAPAPAGQLGG